MSPKPQKPKEKIEAKIPDSTIIVNQPMVRTFSTGGGHGPEDTLARLSPSEPKSRGQATSSDA
jgi:hypothetical protein